MHDLTKILLLIPLSYMGYLIIKCPCERAVSCAFGSLVIANVILMGIIITDNLR